MNQVLFTKKHCYSFYILLHYIVILFILKTLQSPWMTKGLINSSKKKQRLYQKFLRKRTIYNETTYKNYKNQFQTLCFQAKRKYYQDRINYCVGNQQKIWKVLNELINTNKKQK